jgi:hypothetical protein
MYTRLEPARDKFQENIKKMSDIDAVLKLYNDKVIK